MRNSKILYVFRKSALFFTLSSLLARKWHGNQSYKDTAEAFRVYLAKLVPLVGIAYNVNW